MTTLKMAVFAPIPSASVSSATTVNPGFFRKVRSANRMLSCINVSIVRRSSYQSLVVSVSFAAHIRSRRSATSGSTRMARRAGIQVATSATTPSTAITPPNVIGSVTTHPEQQRLQQPRHRQRRRGADGETGTDEAETAPQHQPQDFTGVGSQRHADANLLRSPRDVLRQHAVDANRRQQQRQDRRTRPSAS